LADYATNRALTSTQTNIRHWRRIQTARPPCAAQRRVLHMVLRLLAANAEHWLAQATQRLPTRPNEYQATTANLLHRGSTITYTPQHHRAPRPTCQPQDHPGTHPAHRPTRHQPTPHPRPITTP
ncbi:MAG: hypothetical protein ACRDTZ_13170, partial [Pseudonocardiaceae bacterium]